MDKLEEIRIITENCPELNMGNYDDDQVRELNNAMIEISSILNIGSELGVLDAPEQSHGDLLAVGKSHASGADSTEVGEQTSAGTLGKIIDEKKSCCFTGNCIYFKDGFCDSNKECVMQC